MSLGGRPSEGWLTRPKSSVARSERRDRYHAVVTDPSEPSHERGPLARPPSERYAGRPDGEDQARSSGEEALAAGASPSRGVAFGLIGGLIGAVFLVLFGAVFPYSAG